MLKGERGFFALVILCLVAAGIVWTALRPPFPELPSDEYKQAEETKYSPGSPACYPSRLDSLSKGEAADERYRCETQADQHRLQSDDLVQQTRAADASAAAVNLTYRQMLIELAGAIFGLLTLLAAAYAAWYARRAAAAGDRANVIAQVSHEEALSPYIIVSKAWFEIDSGIQPIAHVELKNFGPSPAIDVETWYHMWVECFPLHDPLPTPPPDLVKGRCNIGPGGTSEIYHPRGNPLNGVSQTEIMAGKAALYVYGESVYRDMLGNRFVSRFTLFCRGADQIKKRRLTSYMSGNEIIRIPRKQE